MAYGADVARPSRRTSRETPRQEVPSLDQLVTQWMSTVGSSLGSAVNSDHVQLRLAPASVVTVKLHSSVRILGVGPADRTGKSRARCWPGGSSGSCSWRRR